MRWVEWPKCRCRKASNILFPPFFQELKNRVTRQRLRFNFVAALKIGLEGLGNLIPGVDLPADVMLVATLARTASEYRQLAIDAAAALDFVKQGPRNLEDLRVSSSYQEFPNYRAFVKGEVSLHLVAKMFGSAGAGNQYHHIVTQGGLNGKKFPAELLQNTRNVLPLPTLLHEVATDEYRKPAPDGSARTLYRWLQTQPYEVQREIGLGREPINLPGSRLARVRNAPIATKFRSAAKRREGPRLCGKGSV